MRIALAALVVFSASTLVEAQPLAPARFEVASVKVNPKQSRGGFRSMGDFSVRIVDVLPGGRVESYGRSLRDIIAWAYEINTLFQKIEGTQDVLQTEFDIEAKAVDTSLTPAEARAMVRTLLQERFQLRGRLQPRDVDGLLLMPAREDGRPGPGLRPFTGDCDARANNRSVPFTSPDFEQQSRCNRWSGIVNRQRAVGMSMAAIAERLTNLMATPVFERTGWPGLFSFDITAETGSMPMATVMRAAAGLPPFPSTDGPHLVDALRRELGLQLVKERTTVNDFIVERVEPLIEN